MIPLAPLVSFAAGHWRALAGGLLVVVVLGAVYAKGRNDERHVWVERQRAAADAALERERELAGTIARQAADLEAARGKRQVVTRTLTEQVDRYVPMVIESPEGRACLLAGAVRVLHDAAASGTAADPARIPSAAPVPPADLTRTIIGNYAACHDSSDRLAGWQQWWATVSPSLCTCNR